MKKFGIIGDPIKHSLSPLLHNYWFDKYKIDAEYSILNVSEKEIPIIIKKIKNKELNGINVTLPYKQKIVPHLDILVNDAEITSSVNTVFLDERETIVGENGSNISGGQMQRIAIARALYLSPQVLILDEFTSSLDSEVEKQILNEIKKLKKNKTIILITHNLNSLKICDEIFKIDNGKLIKKNNLPETNN